MEPVLESLDPLVSPSVHLDPTPFHNAMKTPSYYPYFRIITLGLLASLSSLLRADVREPQLIPQPAKATQEPYQPQALLPGGIVIPVFPPDSPFLNRERIHEAEVYQMTERVPGRVQSIVNVHNPSIEVHRADAGSNTGAVIILLAGGGHRRLVVGGESIDPVPYFFNYGINCVILRYRLRNDGYVAEVDAVNDTLQAIRLVRSHAKQWDFDPEKIGVMGFSAGAEPAAAAALKFREFDAENNDRSDPLAGISSRPDFVSLIYPGPSPLTKNPDLAFPKNVPPAFLANASYGDARHTQWALDYYMAMLKKEVPNIELHLYAQGGHGGGLKDRKGTPYGTWPSRYIDWLRDLGFLQKSGQPTKAARDIEAYLQKP